jgi:hypothetical protein
MTGYLVTVVVSRREKAPGVDSRCSDPDSGGTDESGRLRIQESGWICRQRRIMHHPRLPATNDTPLPIVPGI